VAEYNTALRFHWRRPKNDGSGGRALTDVPNSIKWYTMLYRCDPRCSSSNCQRLLSSSRVIKKDQNRDYFLVGVVDARTGSRMVRAFISENRAESPCLVGWLRDRDPHLALICIFLWFGQRFHTQTPCRASQGKWAQNF
jgi:hypothetical protein